uniref:Uncharacterized protein n=1 Tax=Arundo donax TaxID=35708 RepID=A0A0A9HJV3_ARUDO
MAGKKLVIMNGQMDQGTNRSQNADMFLSETRMLNLASWPQSRL